MSKSTLKRHMTYGKSPREPENMIVMRHERAIELAQTWSAMKESRTWGEFRKKAPPKMYEEAIDLLTDEPRPKATQKFEMDAISGVGDGDWPGFPEQEMLELLPKSVINLGKISVAMINGYMLELPSSAVPATLRILTAKGWAVERDDDLVFRACGFP